MSGRKRNVYVAIMAAALLVVVLALYKDSLLNFLYHSRFFHPSSERVRTVESDKYPVFNLQLSVSDLQFLNTDGRVSFSPTRAWQEVTLETDERQYHVDLSHFESYFSRFPPVAHRPSFSIRFPQNEFWNRGHQYDLFLHKEIDIFEQQLLYNLGDALGLYKPRAYTAKILFDYEDNGLFVLKQAFDQVFLRQMNLENGKIFMINLKIRLQYR